jgi:tetratricopeptide (TPR) repeat protein
MLPPDLESELPSRQGTLATGLELKADELELLAHVNQAACVERGTALIEAAREAQDARAEMKATHHVVGVLLARRSELDRAAELARRSYALAHAADDAVWHGRTEMSLAFVAVSQGEYGLAMERHNTALERFRSVGYKTGIAASLLNLAGFMQILGMPEEALPMLREARTLYSEDGDSAKAAIPLWIMAEYHCDEMLAARRAGDAGREREEAMRVRDMMDQALHADRSQVQPHVQHGGYVVLCRASVALGQLGLARQALDGADALLAAFPMPAETTSRDTALAQLLRAEGDPKAALRVLEEALRYCDEHNIRLDRRQDVLHHLSETREALGDLAGAIADLRSRDQLQRRISNAFAMTHAKLLRQQLQAERERHRCEIQSLLDRRAGEQPSPPHT